MYGFAPNVKPNPQHALAVTASAATINVAVLRIMKLTLNFYAFGFKTWRSHCRSVPISMMPVPGIDIGDQIDTHCMLLC